MKKEYIKPLVGIVMLASEIIMDENSGVASNPKAKEIEFEEENETGIPDSYTSIWGDDEEKEN